MTARERIDEIVNGVKKTELGFLMELCVQTFAVQFKAEAIVQTNFGYNAGGRKEWILEELNTGFEVCCSSIHECYEEFLRFVFENVHREDLEKDI